MNQAFLDYYRCPEEFANFALGGPGVHETGAGYFAFGDGVTLYGRYDVTTTAGASTAVPDLLQHVKVESGRCLIPFDPSEVAENLRYERYVEEPKRSFWKRLQREGYYAVRPLLSTAIRRHLQRAFLSGWEEKEFPRWPVDRSLDKMFNHLMTLTVASAGNKPVPFIWFWPKGYSACAVMTHDVETRTGLDFTAELKAINASFEIPASYQLIPGARYQVEPTTLRELQGAGCEVNVHDWKHDGHLFDDREKFEKDAIQINSSAESFGAKGFRAGALYRNQSWLHHLKISYDMSVPNVAHLDPQPGGCCTVMPYFIGDVLELPVTATQDYSLFNILELFSMDLWRKQIDLVLEQHGLLNFIVHPDYLEKPEALACYKELLTELSLLRVEAKVWIPLPREVNEWWRQRQALQLVRNGCEWSIDGEGAERACIAYATSQDGKLSYAFAE